MFDSSLKKIGILITFLFIAFGAIIGTIAFGKGKKSTSEVATQVYEKSLSPLKEVLTSQEKKCPSGFIRVPGDKTYNTTDFCVMKYDAKCANVSDLSHGLQPEHGTACSGESGGNFYGTYKNSGPGCACVDSKQVVSTQSGFPLAYIPEKDASDTNAKKYCEHLGWHLITNPEWMTIARNVEKVSDNWCKQNGTECGFAPGSPHTILANGHNDGNNEASASASENGALIAADDLQPCFGTTTDGSNTCGGKGSQKRTLTLTNKEVIWDLAGNVWSWIDIDVPRKDQPQSLSNGVLDQGWIWSEFAPGGKETVITGNGSGAELGYDSFRPSSPSWNSTNGVGRIYHYSAKNDTDTTIYTSIRGGTWQHGYDSGAFSVHLSPKADHPNINDVGLRCVAPL